MEAAISNLGELILARVWQAICKTLEHNDNKMTRILQQDAELSLTEEVDNVFLAWWR